MEYTSDSDLSDDTKELVNRGLASVKRKRRILTQQADDAQPRILDSNMDTSNVRHPSRREASIDDASTHGLTTSKQDIVNSQKHNTLINNEAINLKTMSSCRKDSKCLLKCSNW